MAQFLVLGNTARRHDDKRFNWTFYVRGATHLVDSVVVGLHPTFKDPVRTLTGPTFELQSQGWGTFSLDVSIRWKGGGELATTWELQFDAADANRQEEVPPEIEGRALVVDAKPPAVAAPPPVPGSSQRASLPSAAPASAAPAVQQQGVPQLQSMRTAQRRSAAACYPARQQRQCAPPARPPLFAGFGGAPSVAEDFDDDDQLEVDSAVSTAAHAQPEPDPTPEGSGVISVGVRVEYSALARGQIQNVFGLVTLQAAAAGPDDGKPVRQPMDVLCVLDVSGSMQGNKIREVQDAMRFIIEQADPKDRVGIIAFNSTASRVLRLRRMDAEGKNAATVATLRLQAGGGTSIAAGLDTALSVMEQRRQRNKVSAILLLTDGQDRSTRPRLPSLIARARQASCALYAFGFGADHDAALLSEVSEQAETPFTFVEDTEHIREAFAGAVGGLASIMAQGLELTLACHVPLRAVHTPFTVHRDPDGMRATVTVPDFFAGERRDILVELEVPAEGGGGADAAALLEASARYTDLRRDCLAQTPAAVMVVERVAEPQPEAEPDTEVSAQRERVEITQALQQAADRSDQGNFTEARAVLDAADQRMKGSKKKTRVTDALCEELEDARSRMQSSSSWEMGGRAEVKDAAQMHSMQRCTKKSCSSKSAVQKMSKSMYCSAAQDEMIEKSKR